MDNGQHHNLGPCRRTGMDFRSQRPPPVNQAQLMRPPPTNQAQFMAPPPGNRPQFMAPPPANQPHLMGPPPANQSQMMRPPPTNQIQHHQNNYFTPSSFQNPGLSTAHNAFQTGNLPEAAYDQPATPSIAFHNYRFTPPDFSCPPPSLHPTGSLPFSPQNEIQQQRTVMPPHSDCGFASVSNPSHGGVGSLPDPPSYSDPISFTFTESSRPLSTSGELAMHEEESELRGEEDELKWLKNFEHRILSRSTQLSKTITTKEKPLKLFEVQQMVSQSRILSDKLCQLKEKMSLLGGETQDRVWLELVDQAESAKMELSKITQILQDKDFIEQVRLLINQRRKKRERTKKQHKRKVEEKRELQIQWKKKEEKIDAWREKLRLKEEEKRREVAIKTEADSILGEVRQKQIDGTKMQQLLENLISLRIVRLNKGATHGFVSTPQHDQLFTNTIKNISEVVETQMKEYKLEEQTLRVMMEESTSYQRSNAGKEPRDTNKLETTLKKVLFSDVLPADKESYEKFTAADHSLEILLQRRNDWDQFLCEEDAPLGSSIPLNWVIPPSEPTTSWRQYQSRTKNVHSAT